MYKVGDVVIPKPEWLDQGEIAKPAIVLDAWWDNDLRRQKIAVINVDEAAEIKDGRLIGFPLSRLDTFADYYAYI